MLVSCTLVACRENERSAPRGAPPPAAAAAAAPYTKQAFPSAKAALEAALAETKPRLVAFGEVHAPLDAGVASATERFRQELLPLLAPRAAALVVEAWQPAGCNQAVEAKIAQANGDIVQRQAKTNPNEYLALAQDAKLRGVIALPLRPTCDESAKVADAGAHDVDTLLQTVRAVAERTLDGAVAKVTPDAGTPKLVLFYGGALHNDLAPSPERASWSFGPALDRRTEGGFVEIDLIVPEFIKDNETWQSLAWRRDYDVARDGATVQLFRRSGKSFVIVFAVAAPATPQAP